ncbi:MAG: HAMP domain-containing histidine kinase [Candidatus Eremiobacteraeota bacterium]|nr:HAMP domain-containing histidine kinase [Candidatus Eremiobacteraeota bacterium]
MIARTSALYLLIFICVLVALDIGAYAFMAREYASFLQPALGTPEGAAAMAAAMRRVVVTIVLLDIPLVVAVGAASYLLARATLAPIFAARERERVFASDVAHELRSPLATIAAVAQAARSSASAESRRAFEAIAASALDTSAIVTDLLTLARQPGQSVLQCEPVDLAVVVARCARDASDAAAARGIRLETAPASAIVDGDERRLRELTRNLLENAIRHAHSFVRVSSQRNGRTCEVVVEDDGEGIPAAERERVFERFYRRSDDGAGTGLGLAIVRWIAQAHAGTVSVAQSDEGGAQFVASIPEHAS